MRNRLIHPASMAFDIDGVFADTMGLFLDIAREEFGVDGVRYEDITCYTLAECIDMPPDIIEKVVGKIIEGDYRARLRPLPGATRVVASIASRHRPVLFVTARPHLGPMPEWMNTVLPLGTDEVELIATGAFEKKAEVLLEKRITYFVEDRLDTCYALEAAGITSVLFKQPWNREAHPFMEVGSWKELEAHVAV